MKHITPPETILPTPLSKARVRTLKAGQEVLLTGTIYTARDQAHKRLVQLLTDGAPLPLDLRGQILYYCGPNPTPPGSVIGACGPTTSSRMDAFTPQLLEYGIAALIGKGERGPDVVRQIRKSGAVYFATYSGCGALLAGCVRRQRVVGFSDLGTEAIYELQVEGFPLIVAIDSRGAIAYAENR